MDEEYTTRGVHREYRTDAIAVKWDSAYCTHAAECLRRLPGVFNSQARPWVSIDAATADEIAETISACPSGALHFERLDGGAGEHVPDVVEIKETRNGPLYLRGHVRILAEDGTVIREDTRIALCRCGHSENKPFCDDSHTRVGWRSRPKKEKPKRELPTV